MVDTKDSKSFVSDGVRVQVSSPVKRSCFVQDLFFLTWIDFPAEFIHFQDLWNFCFHKIGEGFS